tara:strand:+ start:26895 stop:27707 length:813 start_codon:yes stop_codon:yes gene_type:complete
MKKTTFLYIVAVAFLLSNFAIAQVGIGTSSPKGVLDIDSNTFGVVYPKVVLTATNVAAPVVNPNGGSLAVGTTVYNTNTTNTGTKDVEPGIYSWDGTQWVTHFFKRQSELFKQTSVLRTSSSLGWQDVPNLGFLSANTFTAKYSGLYRIEVKTHFGGGRMDDNGDVNVAAQQGLFRFTFDGTNYNFDTKSYSVYNDNIGSGVYFTNIAKEAYITKYINLTAGQTYSFYLQFNQETSPGFESDGDLFLTLDGRGYVGDGIPCQIEFTYIDE